MTVVLNSFRSTLAEYSYFLTSCRGLLRWLAMAPGNAWRIVMSSHVQGHLYTSRQMAMESLPSLHAVSTTNEVWTVPRVRFVGGGKR
jgi:hypothetical protein